MTPGISGATIEQRWSRVRNLFLDRLWLSLFLYACLAVPLSVSRVFVTGWQTVYGVHFLFLVVIGATWLLRARLPFNVRLVLLVLILDATAFGGVLTFGLMGSAWWWLFLAGLIVALLNTMRAGVIHTVATTCLLIGLAFGYVQGYLTLGFDMNTYATSVSAWLTLTAGPALMTICLFLSVATFQQEMQALLREAHTLRHFSPTCAPCRKEWTRTLDAAAQSSL